MEFVRWKELPRYGGVSEQQIPFGNDSQKSKGKDSSEGERPFAWDDGWKAMAKGLLRLSADFEDLVTVFVYFCGPHAGDFL